MTQGSLAAEPVPLVGHEHSVTGRRAQPVPVGDEGQKQGRGQIAEVGQIAGVDG